MRKISNDIPLTQEEKLIFGVISLRLKKKVADCLKMRPYFDRLEQELRINSEKEKIFTCSFCQRDFSNVHKRSAHMNAHRKQTMKLRGKKGKKHLKPFEYETENKSDTGSEASKNDFQPEPIQSETIQGWSEYLYAQGNFDNLYEDKLFADVLNLEFEN